MKANELMQKLNVLVQQHGDCEVVHLGDGANALDVLSIELSEIDGETSEAPKEKIFVLSTEPEVDPVAEIPGDVPVGTVQDPTEATVAPTGDDAPTEPVDGEVDAEAKQAFEDAKA